MYEPREVAFPNVEVRRMVRKGTKLIFTSVAHETSGRCCASKYSTSPMATHNIGLRAVTLFGWLREMK
jgi:hypothetical protein